MSKIINNVNNHVLSGFAWQSSTKIIVQCLSWFSTIYVARLLSPEDYGLVAISGIFTIGLGILSQAGLAQGLVQKKSIATEEVDGVFYISVIFGAFGYTILFYISPYIASFYDLLILEDIIRVSGLVIIINSIKAAPFSIAMRDMNFRYRAIAEMFSTFSMICVVLYMASSGYGVWSLVFGTVTKMFIELLFYLRLLNHFPSPFFSLSKILNILIFGSKIMLNSVFEFIYNHSDIFIISKYINSKSAGNYSFALTLASIPVNKIGRIFDQVAFPTFSRIQDRLDETKELFLKLHRYILIICYPFFVGLALTSHDVVILLLTEKWIDTVPIIKVFCFINLFRISVNLMSSLLKARGKPEKVLTFSLYSMIVLPIGFLLGLPFGMPGILAAWILIYPVLYSLILHYCLEELRLSFREFVNTFVPAIVATSIMSLCVILVTTLFHGDPTFFKLITIILTAIFFYIFTFIILFKNEFNKIIRFYKNISFYFSKDI